MGLAIAIYMGWIGSDYLPSWAGGYTYKAEVGYYQDGTQAWFVGENTSREKCIQEAVMRFNSLNNQNPKRAFSWACRKMQGDNFLERVR
jgi:hypothetical protein